MFYVAKIVYYNEVTNILAKKSMKKTFFLNFSGK